MSIIGEWIEGAPPETFVGQDEVLIVAKLPSRFLPNQYGYRAFRWSNGSWGTFNDTSYQELSRATKHMLIPLPKSRRGAE